MKRVRVTYEAIVSDDKVKAEEDVISEGFEDLEDAVFADGLEGVIDGSFNYTFDFEISDVSEQEGE